jgi:hypothetical protein
VLINVLKFDPAAFVLILQNPSELLYGPNSILLTFPKPRVAKHFLHGLSPSECAPVHISQTSLRRQSSSGEFEAKMHTRGRTATQRKEVLLQIYMNKTSLKTLITGTLTVLRHHLKPLVDVNLRSCKATLSQL